MSVNRDRQEAAAARLEELGVVLKEYVCLLREGQGDELAYAMVYYLRREIGRVVNKLGVDVPQKQHVDRASEIAESQIRNATGFGK